jgi:hypothetical protein
MHGIAGHTNGKMNSLPYDLNSVDLDTLQQLRDEGAREGKHLDFKLRLDFTSDSQRTEILRDISSFANSVGGDILFGVDEDAEQRDLMGEIIGIEDAMSYIPRIEESLRRGVNPRIPGIQYHSVAVDSSRHVLIVRVAKSPVGPHMVTHQDDYRVYGRGESGKTRLSIQELSDLILNTESLEQRLRSFRLDRVARLNAGDFPVPIAQGPHALFHLLPLASFTGDVTFTSGELIEAARHRLLPPGTGGTGWRATFEGAIHASHAGSTESWGYSMLFRNGSAEALRTGCGYRSESITVYRGAAEQEEEGVLLVAEQGILDNALTFLHECATVYLALGLSPTWFVSVQVIGARGYALKSFHRRLDRPTIREHHLDLGLVAIDEVPASPLQWAEHLRPLMDRLANAGGEVSSSVYDG